MGGRFFNAKFKMLNSELLFMLHQFVDILQHLVGITNNLEVSLQAYYRTNQTTHTSCNKEALGILQHMLCILVKEVAPHQERRHCKQVIVTIDLTKTNQAL